ncbi:MAG: hypothetical protein R3B93_08270 [Bacteroidia bacterium]
MEKGIYDGSTDQYRHLIEDGYDFHLGDYISRGWEIFTSKGWSFFGFTLLFIIISGVVGSITENLSISNLNVIGTIIETVISGALTAGFFVVADKIHHGENSDFGDFFKGFDDFAQIAYSQLLIQVFALAAGSILLGRLFIGTNIWEAFIDPATPLDLESIREMLTSVKFITTGSLVLLILLYISVAYQFTIPLIVFGRLKFWDAMETSRRIITRNFFNFFLLYMVSIVFLFIGMLVFIVGVFAAVAFMFCITYAAYIDIVGHASSLEDKIEEIGNNPE